MEKNRKEESSETKQNEMDLLCEDSPHGDGTIYCDSSSNLCSRTK